MAKPSEHFWVNGVVAVRDKKPYIQLSTENGMVAQFSIAEALSVARDIYVMAARTEADALIHQFFEEMSPGKDVGAHIMLALREYRAKIDDEQVGHSHRNPPSEG